MRKTFQLRFEWDIVNIRSEVREIAKEVGFNELDQARIVQSISELARNVIHHAEKGYITIYTVEEEERKGLRIQVQDSGPGIPNFEELMTRGQSQNIGETSGLQQVEMLMDELTSIPVEEGTCVEVTKWLKPSQMLE
ncbi:ATP-binding protein [Paenactinomyces guangxiensis]|uniref:ATP-binding protein n=1 Tax=Paenactinomyces guangxiensis TaxID=1490290 RepID=A0A7W2A981_9BACL|nr:ATP-binding protein [Paenactinomyces guangxiensis]MBA4495455.1 ATP-binding protein [Paenactinomyces guangxiensis]MBH8592422.1 ATP-binding protein [Paenactinomyces guangxiensis]